MPLPVVERVAPKLPGAGKVIGRHACHDRRHAVRVEAKKPAPAPYVRAVVGDEDRKVADHAHPAPAGRRPDRFPLPAQEKLLELRPAQVRSQLLCGGFQGLGFAVAVGLGPVGPGHAAKRRLERVKKSELLDPVRFRLQKSAIGDAQGIVFRTLEKILRGPNGQLELVAVNAAIVHQPIAGQPQRAQHLPADQSVGEKRFGAEQGRIRGEGGKSLIRRVAVTRRVERKNLPKILLAGGQHLNPLVDAGTEIPDAVVVRQGGRIQQDTAIALKKIFVRGHGENRRSRETKRASPNGAPQALFDS